MKHLTGDDTPPDTQPLNDTAQHSFEIVDDIVGDKKNSGAKLRNIGLGVLDGLVERATAAAKVAIDPHVKGAAIAWNDTLEQLHALDLTPTLYCNKSGRNLGLISPAPWQDYLAAIFAARDTLVGSGMETRLLAAIVAQKAHAVGPCVLTTSTDNLAMIRETSPADYIAIALQKLIPLEGKIDSTAQAMRAENLGRARQLMDLLPPSSLQFVCEVLTLFLSNIRPAKIPDDLNTLLTYGNGANADLAAPFESVATLGHFCGRIVQMILKLLAQHRIKPLDKLTASDIAALRVHWIGDPVYAAIKAARHEFRLAARGETAAPMPSIGIGAAGFDTLTKRGLDNVLPDLGAAIDLSMLLGAMGRKTPVKLQSEIEADLALERQGELRAQHRELQAAEADVELFDLSGMLVSGGVPSEMLPTLEDDNPADALALFNFDDFDNDFEDEDDADDWASAMSDATAKPRKTITTAKPAKPAKPIDPRLARIQQIERAHAPDAVTRKALPVAKPAFKPFARKV